MRKCVWVICLAVLFNLTAISGCSPARQNDDETLVQVSTLNALMLGSYDGVITVEDLLQNGDTGLGTFDTLDGEMIVLNGTVYQAKADGSVVTPPGDTMVPFAAVTRFDGDITMMLENIGDIDALKSAFTQAISQQNENIFYMATVSGDFDLVHVRSVSAQQKPYKPLSEVTESQKEYEYDHVSGTLVALYCPDYVSGINLSGWHIHFISSDGTKGGHVLNASFHSAKMKLDSINAFKLILPDTDDFAALELATDMQNAAAKAESK